jgi:hypothetical protein
MTGGSEMKRLSQLRNSWLFIVIVSFLVACGSAQDKIVGKWSEKTSGKWSTLDDGRIKVDVMAYGGTVVFFFVLVGDELEMDMDGKKWRLIRIK